MKKLLLFLAGAVMSAGAMAQENHSIFLTPVSLPSGGKLVPASSSLYTPRVFNKVVAESKGTSTLYSDWYSQWSALKDASITGNLFYWETYPDSNLITSSGRGTYVHGMGVSFDPADSSYYYNALSSTGAVSAPINDTFSYAVDSFIVEGEYIMNNTSATHDSLIVEFAVSPTNSTNDSGVYKLRYRTSAAAFLPISYDGRPRFTTAAYNRPNKDIYTLVKTQSRRYAYPLTAARLADTINGVQAPLQFTINPPIVVPPHCNVVSFVHFKSGTAYALGTPVTSANLYHLFAGEPSGTNTWTRQSATDSVHGYAGSYQDGLIAQNQTIYGDTTTGAAIGSFDYDGHDVLIPAVAFAGNTPNDPPGFTTPLQYFHIKWNSDGSLTGIDTTGSGSAGHGGHPNAVANVNTNTIMSRAYPNPASVVAYVPFTLTQAAEVNVVFTNTLGQVVNSQNLGKVSEGTVTFNTSALATGVYFYTITADGLRSTGRVVVSH